MATLNLPGIGGMVAAAAALSKVIGWRGTEALKLRFVQVNYCMPPMWRRMCGTDRRREKSRQGRQFHFSPWPFEVGFGLLFASHTPKVLRFLALPPT